MCYFSKTVSSSVYLTKSTWEHLGAAGFIPSAPALSLSSTLLGAPCHWPRGGMMCVFGKMLLRISTRQNPWAPPLKNVRIWLQPKNAKENPFLGLWHWGKLLNTGSNISTVHSPVWFQTKWLILVMNLNCCHCFSEFMINNGAWGLRKPQSSQLSIMVEQFGWESHLRSLGC